MGKTYEGKLVGTGLRFGIVAGKWNDFMGEKLIEGAEKALVRHGVSENDIDVIFVPGGMEIPLACKAAAKSGQYDGLVAIGVVIRGSTLHFDIVAKESNNGITKVGLETGVPIGAGIICCENIQQAIERSGSKVGNKGEEAALAALEMVNLLKSLKN